MMDEYIKRIDVYKILRRIYCDRCYGMDDCEVCDVQRTLNLVKAQPYCDVAEVRHGEWIPIVIQENYFDPPYCDTCKCSICGYEIDVSETIYNYCPNCGAKMDGKGEGE